MEAKGEIRTNRHGRRRESIERLAQAGEEKTLTNTHSYLAMTVLSVGPVTTGEAFTTVLFTACTVLECQFTATLLPSGVRIVVPEGTWRDYSLESVSVSPASRTRAPTLVTCCIARYHTPPFDRLNGYGRAWICV